MRREFWQRSNMIALLGALTLVGCDSSSSSGDDNTGSLRFYNISQNSPAIYLTVDEDLSDEDDDAFEKTYTGVEFTEISGSTDIDVGDYAYEIAFQDDDSTVRDDLNILLEGTFTIEEDTMQLVVLDGDISASQLSIFTIEDIDDDNDDDEDLFNLRVLNMSDGDNAVNLYFSKDDETFNEAVLLSQVSYQELADNQKFEQDSYIFYIADDSNEILYQSDEISFEYALQYVMVIRDNTAEGTSPYILDKISNSTAVEYIDVNTESHIRAFNAIVPHDLLPEYQGNIILSLDSVDDSTTTESFAFGEFSESLVQSNDDYSLDVVIAETGEKIVTNHLLTLPENSIKTVFFYLTEEAVDDDSDGDIDEDNDGEIDEIEITVNSLVLENNVNDSIYDHQLTLVNLLDSDDFDFVRFYFVRSNEMIDSTPYQQLVSFGQSAQTTLLNNTYSVYVVAEDGSSEIILHSFEMTLDAESNEQFLILQADSASASGYRVNISE